MELPHRYPYNPKWRAILNCLLFFGACSAFMAYRAFHNTVGLTINGVITLGPAGATVFCWVVAAGGAGFLLLALLLTFRRIASPQVFELGTDALVLPHGFLQRQPTRIAYSDIQGLSEVQVYRQTFLYVTVAGRKFTIIASAFPDKDSYLAVRDFLLSHVQRSQSN
ncbi:MAG: hypothetical protein WCO71_07280 [Pseudomonadota bacterium]